MTRIHPAARAAAGVVAGLLVSISGSAQAQMAPCSSLTNPIYIGGSTAIKPALKQIAQFFATRTPAITLVYQSIGSCSGVADLFGKMPAAGGSVFWDPANAVPFTETACDPGAGFQLDVGVSDVYAQTCTGMDVPGGFADHQGAVQMMELVAPLSSSQNSISEEAAYVVLGFGGTSNAIEPWSNKANFFIRPDSSGTKNMIARAIKLPVAKWQGTIPAKGGSGDVLTALQGSTDVNGTIGILSADFVDAHRDTLKTLAFQAKGQECGYVPDSAPNKFDKLNTREGRYAIWGPIHYLTNVTGNNPVPAQGNSGDVATFIKYVTHAGLTPDENKSLIGVETNGFTVPQCAMKVSRTAEVGPMSSFQPDVPCGCYFESIKGEVSTGCKSCTGDNDCTTANNNHCRYGYCEAK